MDRVRANRAVWKLLRVGAKVTFATDDGGRATQAVRFIDWSTPANNDFLAVSQFWVVGPLHTRRCDVVCFVNGIPLVLFELKASHKTMEHAYSKNLRDYRDTIPQLFTPNALAILSNGSETKVGSTFAPWERFGEWKRIDDEQEPGVVSLETAICGLCEPSRLLDMAENFVGYLERPGGLIKVLAQNHQVLGVNAAMRALRDEHTRGATRRLLAHAGLGQEPLDAVLHAKGAASRAGQLDVRDGYRQGRARRSALRRGQGRRGGRGAPAGHLVGASSPAARRGPSLRLHADPQVPHRPGQ